VADKYGALVGFGRPNCLKQRLAEREMPQLITAQAVKEALHDRRNIIFPGPEKLQDRCKTGALSPCQAVSF
jgi:hypothetical protein